MYMAALKGISRNRAKVRIEELLEAVNLKGAEKKKIAAFSRWNETETWNCTGAFE